MPKKITNDTPWSDQTLRKIKRRVIWLRVRMILSIIVSIAVVMAIAYGTIYVMLWLIVNTK